MISTTSDYIKLLDQICKQIIGNDSDAVDSIVEVKDLVEKLENTSLGSTDKLGKVIKNLTELHGATSGATQVLVQQTIAIIQEIVSSDSESSIKDVINMIDRHADLVVNYFEMLKQEVTQMNPPKSSRVSYSVDLSLDVPAVGPTVVKFDTLKDTLGAVSYVPIEYDTTDCTFISKYLVVTLSTLYGFTFSQTGWKWDDRISLRVYDVEPADRYDLDHPYVTIIDRIRTKELGQYKRLAEGYIIESGKVLVVVYENLSGNSKKVFCDADLMRGAI